MSSEQIGFLDPLAQRWRDRGAQVADVALRAVVEHVLAAERAGGGQAVRLGEGHDLAHALSLQPKPPTTSSGRSACQASRAIAMCSAVAAGCVAHVRLGVATSATSRQHVLGQRQHHRARASGSRQVKGAGDVFGNARGDVDLAPPIWRPARTCAGSRSPGTPRGRSVAADLADEQDHRRRILERGVHADRGVAGAGPARDHGDAGLAGELAIGFRHVGGASLVARVDQREAVAHVVERVEHLEIALAGHAERHLDAVDQQTESTRMWPPVRGPDCFADWVGCTRRSCKLMAAPCHRPFGAAT